VRDAGGKHGSCILKCIMVERNKFHAACIYSSVLLSVCKFVAYAEIGEYGLSKICSRVSVLLKLLGVNTVLLPKPGAKKKKKKSISMKQRPRRAAARHLYHPEIPAPGRQPKDPGVILLLTDQKRRLAEVLRADCPLDELMLFREYVKVCMRFPVNVRWIDPDFEEKQVVEVCCLGLKEDYDRRGLLVKCSLPTGATRMIPFEQLQGPWVDDDATWDMGDAVKVASRLIGDYCFWVNELRGLDPSTSNFGDDDEEEDGLYEDQHGETLFRIGGGGGGGGGAGGGGVMAFSSDGSELDGQEQDDMLIGEEEGALGENGDDLNAFLGQEAFDELSSAALSELEGRMHPVDGDDGGDMDLDDDEEEDNDGDDFEDEDLIPLGGPEDELAEAEDDEKNWKLAYDDDLDVGLPEAEWQEEEEPRNHHLHHHRLHMHE
jgi:hypothetical protein